MKRVLYLSVFLAIMGLAAQETDNQETASGVKSLKQLSTEKILQPFANSDLTTQQSIDTLERLNENLPDDLKKNFSTIINEKLGAHILRFPYQRQTDPILIPEHKSLKRLNNNQLILNNVDYPWERYMVFNLMDETNIKTIKSVELSDEENENNDPLFEAMENNTFISYSDQSDTLEVWNIQQNTLENSIILNPIENIITLDDRYFVCVNVVPDDLNYDATSDEPQQLIFNMQLFQASPLKEISKSSYRMDSAVMNGYNAKRSVFRWNAKHIAFLQYNNDSDRQVCHLWNPFNDSFTTLAGSLITGIEDGFQDNFSRISSYKNVVLQPRNAIFPNVVHDIKVFDSSHTDRIELITALHILLPDKHAKDFVQALMLDSTTMLVSKQPMLWVLKWPACSTFKQAMLLYNLIKYMPLHNQPSPEFQALSIEKRKILSDLCTQEFPDFPELAQYFIPTEHRGTKRPAESSSSSTSAKIPKTELLTLQQLQAFNYYQILGAEQNATEEQINAAYKNRALQWDPNNHLSKDKDLAEENIKGLQEAYEVLSDPTRREEYDLFI